MTFYDRIIDLCVKNNINKTTLEKTLGFSQNSVNKWKTSIPSVKKVQQLADFFNVSPAYLMGFEPNNTYEKKKEEVKYEYFADLIEKKRLTAYRVAKDTNLTTVLFTDWKKGKSNPKFDKLSKIAEYLNVPVSYFIDGKEDNAYEEKKSEAKSLLGDLTPEEIKKVQEYIVFLKSQRKK